MKGYEKKKKKKKAILKKTDEKSVFRVFLAVFYKKCISSVIMGKSQW